jgi:hypothetical protein
MRKSGSLQKERGHLCLAESNKGAGWLFVCTVSILLGWMVEPIAEPAYFVAGMTHRDFCNRFGSVKCFPLHSWRNENDNRFMNPAGGGETA